ncbi:MAG: putative RNA uridine N3 methyltransferase [Candidatus Thorarchaeota archaeon]
MGLQVAIPDTALVDCSDLRQKTTKVGAIARALAIFRVERVIIYETGMLRSRGKRDSDLIVRLLEYMDTPQYLRRRVFPMTPSLKFVGILPPLRTRSHPLESDTADLKVGAVRWGVQVRLGKVDIGLEQLVDYPESVSERDPTLFRVIQTAPKIGVEPITRNEVDEYWGYEVERASSLVDILQRSKDMTRIVLSRHAPPFDRLEKDIESTVTNTKALLMVFGGPLRGVLELFPDQKELIKEHTDFWANIIPNQGTETVRLEEAMIAGLALLNKSIGRILTTPGFHR